MAFNHDNFIASQNYLDLDASLQWYIDTVGPKTPVLLKLLDENPTKAKLLYQRDPVLQKLRLITKKMDRFIINRTVTHA